MKIKTLFRYEGKPKDIGPLYGEKDVDNDIFVIISPIKDKWNNFGFRIRCDFEILKPIRFKAVIYFAIKSNDKLLKDSETTTKFIDFNKFLEISTHKHEFDEVLNKGGYDYFSMFTEMQDYADLVRLFGVDDAKKILSHHNDLIYLKVELSSSSQFLKYTNSEIYKKAFMRNHESFYMFHNADQVLNNSDLIPRSNISEKLHLNYKLFGRKSQNKLSLEFDSCSILPKRINVLIGKNGLGKSRALYTVADSLISGKRYLLTHNNTDPVFNNLLAIGTPGETESSFPKTINDSKIRYRRVIMGRYSQSKPSYRLGDLISQLLRSDGHIGEIRRRDLFFETIKSIGINDPVIVKLNKNSKVNGFAVIDFGIDKYLRIDKKLLNLNEERLLLALSEISNQPKFRTLTDNKAIPLSSGQSAFIKFAIQASLFIEEGSLVLLDEPETHLHPNYISLFISLLDRILKETKSIAIIATHSAYIVREVPRTQVQVFREDKNGNIAISNPRLKTFGSEIDSISFFIFEDHIHNRLVAQIEKIIPKNKEERRDFFEELKDELSPEMLMYLNRKIKLFD